jgi:acylphosphatase
MRACKVRIEGKVQGVGFRFFILTEAKRFNIKGEVWNTLDGFVEATFHGTFSDINLLLQKCEQGPRLSQVTSLTLLENKTMESTPFTTFSIATK